MHPYICISVCTQKIHAYKHKKPTELLYSINEQSNYIVPKIILWNKVYPKGETLILRQVWNCWVRFKMGWGSKCSRASWCLHLRTWRQRRKIWASEASLGFVARPISNHNKKIMFCFWLKKFSIVNLNQRIPRISAISIKIIKHFYADKNMRSHF